MNPYLSKITIAVPIYSVEKYIERCVRSLFEQTCQDIEYLFVDDGSPDKSIEILRRVLEDYPERKEHVRIIRHERNRGLGAARNTAVEHCHTEFIMHVDSDDKIENNTVDLVLKKQAEGDYDIVSFGTRRINRRSVRASHKSEVTSAWQLSKLILARRWPGSVWGYLYRTALYKENGIRVTEGVNNGEDYCVSARLAYYASKVCTIPDLLYNYYLNNEGAFSESFSEENSRQYLKAFKTNQEFFCDKEDFQTALQEGTSSVIYTQIHDSLRNGYHKDYYYKMRSLWYSLPNPSTKGMKMFDRLILNIRNYYLACAFYRGARYVFRLYHSI